MAIIIGDIIKVEYEGTLEDGEIFDSTELHGGEPLIFEVGAGNVIPGFENAVIGKEVGNEFNIKIQPPEAYGDRNPKLMMKIPKSELPGDLEPESGMVLQISNPQGGLKLGIISQVDEDEILIDMNHPMAGLVLSFKIKVLEIGCELPKHAHDDGCGCGHHH